MSNTSFSYALQTFARGDIVTILRGTLTQCIKTAKTLSDATRIVQIR